jgi:hypothetical protein
MLYVAAKRWQMSTQYFFPFFVGARTHKFCGSEAVREPHVDILIHVPKQILFRTQNENGNRQMYYFLRYNRMELKKMER